MFKKKKSIKISYEAQGLIYFTCLTYRIQPQQVKKRILNLCIEVAGEDYTALFEVLTKSTKTLERISSDYFVSTQRLSLYRKRFYEEWNERYLQGH